MKCPNIRSLANTMADCDRRRLQFENIALKKEIEELKKSPYKCNPNCFNYKVKQELEKRTVK